jgi:hypothetical protein
VDVKAISKAWSRYLTMSDWISFGIAEKGMACRELGCCGSSWRSLSVQSKLVGFEGAVRRFWISDDAAGSFDFSQLRVVTRVHFRSALSYRCLPNSVPYAISFVL